MFSCVSTRTAASAVSVLFLVFVCSRFDVYATLGDLPSVEKAQLSVDHLILSLLPQSAWYSHLLWDAVKISSIPTMVVIFIGLYCVCECVFYLRWQYILHYIKHNITPSTCKPHISNQQCHYIMKRAIHYAELSEGGVGKWLQLWFNDCAFEELQSDNVEDWLFWAMFVEATDNDSSERKSFQRKFVIECRKCLERHIGKPFPVGRNHNIAFAANTKGALKSIYRPLAFYLVLWLSQIATTAILIYFYQLQYTYIDGFKIWYKLAPPHSHAYCQNGHKKNPSPFLFIHGLGAGLNAYLRLFYALFKRNESDTVRKYHFFFLEVPWVTMSIHHFLPGSYFQSYLTNRMPPSTDEYIAIMKKIEQMLRRHSLEKCDRKQLRMLHNVGVKTSDIKNKKLRLNWTLAGHSYGSFLAAGIYHKIRKQQLQLRDKDCRLILVDPVTLCISHPVTVGAVEFRPKDMITRVLQVGVMRELMISVALNRYMHWYEYPIYPLDLLRVDAKRGKKFGRNVVILSEKDTIVPIDLIQRGIDEANATVSNCIYSQVAVKTFPGLPHAAWIATPHVDEFIQLLFEA